MTPPGDLLAPAAWAVLTGLTNLPIVGATKPGQPPAQPGQASVTSRAVNEPLRGSHHAGTVTRVSPNQLTPATELCVTAL